MISKLMNKVRTVDLRSSSVLKMVLSVSLCTISLGFSSETVAADSQILTPNINTNISTAPSLSTNLEISGSTNDSNKAEVLSLAAFIEKATQIDDQFEIILLDQLKLTYNERIALPVSDIIASVKATHEINSGTGQFAPNATASLSRYFPYSGTTLSAAYQTQVSSLTNQESSSATLEFSVPIAKNAFGYADHLLTDVVGLETQIAKYQIVEAYEAYLVRVIKTYIDWYAAYNSLQISKAALKENQKLLENMKARQRSNIALPIDVNKVRLQIIDKEEQLELDIQNFKNVSTLIEGMTNLPAETFAPALPDFSSVQFVNSDDLIKESRTIKTLSTLSEKAGINVLRQSNLLLPSVELILNAEISGSGQRLHNSETEYNAGVSVEFPFGNTVANSRSEIANIDSLKAQKAELDSISTLEEILKNQVQSIKTRRNLLSAADRKVELAQSILRDESENYTFGKATLNEYIQAVNSFDRQRYNQINRQVELQKLIIDWLQFSDQLVN